tara:strand:+ start:1630 stop:1968 length:339 start_codon:yes stop_codon:yes gene_type:complete
MNCYYKKDRLHCPQLPHLEEHGVVENYIKKKEITAENNRISNRRPLDPVEDKIGIEKPLEPVILGENVYFYNSDGRNIYNNKQELVGTYNPNTNMISPQINLWSSTTTEDEV